MNDSAEHTNWGGAREQTEPEPAPGIHVRLNPDETLALVKADEITELNALSQQLAEMAQENLGLKEQRDRARLSLSLRDEAAEALEQQLAECRGKLSEYGVYSWKHEQLEKALAACREDLRDCRTDNETVRASHTRILESHRFRTAERDRLRELLSKADEALMRRGMKCEGPLRLAVEAALAPQPEPESEEGTA